MTNIMLKRSGYGNPSLGKTPFLAIYSQNTHSFTNASILAKKKFKTVTNLRQCFKRKTFSTK
jgi:hypothetical protein